MTPIRVCALLLVSALVALAQPPQNQTPTPPAPTPQGQTGASSQPTPTPEQQRAGANSQMQDQLQSLVSSDPFLSDADVKVSVDDQNVTLTGTIVSEGQRQRVLQLASPYGQYRKIVDKTTVK